MRFDDSFPARYELEELTELPGSGALDLEMNHALDRIVDGGVMLAVTTDDGKRWTALLATALGSLREAHSGIYSTPDPARVIVVARGAAYWINAFEPHASRTIDAFPIVQITPVVAEGVLLLATPRRVTAIDADGTRWRTRRIAIDGVRLDRVDRGRLLGTADPRDGSDAKAFSVDMLTGDADGGYSEPTRE